MAPGRTSQEISGEVAALKALRPVGKFAYTTAKKILACIRELELGQGQVQADLFGHTPGPVEERDEEIKSILMDVRNWKLGKTNYKPSEGWGSLVE